MDSSFNNNFSLFIKIKIVLGNRLSKVTARKNVLNKGKIEIYRCESLFYYSNLITRKGRRMRQELKQMHTRSNNILKWTKFIFKFLKNNCLNQRNI